MGIFKFHETMKGKTNELNTQEKNHPRMFKRINDLTIPINTNRISAWEKDLATNTIKKNEFVSMNLGKKFGYIPTQNIGFLDKVFFTISLIPDYFKVKMYEILKSPNFGIYYKYKLNKS